MKKMLKSAVAFLLATLTFCFSACSVGGGDGDSTGNGDGTNTEQPGGDTTGGNTGGGDDTTGGNTGGGGDTTGGNTGGGDDTTGGNTGGGDDTTGGNTGGDSGTEEPETPLVPVFPEKEEETPEATPTEVAGDSMINTLKSTPYRSAIQNTAYGLTQSYSVGADERAFSRVLYPAPISGVKEYKVADYGVAPDGEYNARDLNALLQELKGVTGTKMLVFDKGTYTFDTTVEISDVEDLYIVGDNTDFIYSTWCNAFRINDCKNIHLNGISVDFHPSAVVAGTVRSCSTSAKTVTIKLNDEFSLSNSLYNGGKIRYGSYMEFCNDGNGNLYPNPNGNLLYNSTGDNVQNITGGTYNASSNELTLTFNSIKSVAAGTNVSVAFTMYEYCGIEVANCENFYTEGCNIYSTAGMGIRLQSVKNAYLNRTNVALKKGSSRLMTVTADGLHAKDCVGDLQLTGSIFENSHDDCINIASFYKEVTAISTRNKTITCEAASIQSNYPVEVGDVIEIYNPATFELLKTYTVTAVTKSALRYVLTVNARVDDSIVGMIVGNVTRSPKVLIQDCIFRNKRNRGILLQTRDSVITGNTFQNIIHGPISIHSAMDIFAEALVPGNVTVSNNKFINNNAAYGLSGDVAIFTKGTEGSGGAGVINNITVTNNFFYNSARTGVFFSSSGNSTISYNLLCKTGAVSSEKYSIYVGTSENVTIKGNCAVRTGSESGFVIYASASATIIDNADFNTTKILGGI